ncbi:hypothetical protein EUTSA_v10025560mg [Eutrema salsugineum]|uniref:RING-type E3 ubiquitin transferase n=1 Tax=Eutrema salsugineum TaxID=72664 RepID=V4MH79_EUTSA|nr:E3 ubiquitin-protein ligase SIRP1 [Eutrema salsugineum]ESQ54642.1 hypothetical protein EUTSA_v10025560mg [Eutrema salsugineum]
MAARYWCHMCSQMVNPIIDAEIKCPSCQSGFVEEMSGDINGGSSSSLREVQDQEIDLNHALSLLGPNLLGMMNNPRRRRRFRRTEFGVSNDEVNGVANLDGNDSNVDNHHHHRRRHRHRQHDGEIDSDREFESILRRRRRSSAAILQLLHGIRAGINSEYESSERSTFNESGVVQGSTGLNHNRNNTSLSSIGDYFVGPGLDQLLEHLADNDPIRYGTLPARKEAVENLLTVKVCEPLQCSVCLDDFDKGSEAKEMPCKHKFHVRCILPWLELHSSCPVCRYELPPDDEIKVDLVRPRTRTLEINLSDENVEDGARNGNGSESRFSFPWPFSGLFSSSSSSSASASGSSQPNQNSYSG